MLRTLARAKIRGLYAAGKSYDKIKKLTGLERFIIQEIVKESSSRTIYKSKTFKPRLFSQADI
jgi:hypothetical protein